MLHTNDFAGSGAESLAAAARFRRWFLLATVAAALAGAIVFVSFPDLDISAARQFYVPGSGPGSGFVWNHPGIGPWIRNVFRFLFGAGIALALFGVLASVYDWRRLLGLDFARSLYLLLCLSIGPGLVANLILKDHWGRARPVQVTELGGKAHFTPPLVPAHECSRNCAFVSGEASNIYALFFSAAFLFPAMRATMVAAGVLGGLASGLVRMAQGGHFLSDVFFAGIFMALTTIFLHWLMFSRRADVFGANGVLHNALAQALGKTAA